MARGRRRRPKQDPSDPSAGARPRRRFLPLAVGLSAVPVGLILAASLMAASGTGTDSAAGPIGTGTAEGSAAPEASSEEDFFTAPSSRPEENTPADGSDPQDAHVTASSVPEDEEAGGGSGSGGGNSGPGSDGGSGSGGGGGGSPSGSTADEVVSLVNSERSAHGCDPVSEDARLASAAQEHSEDMDARDYMGHDSPEGEGPGERAERHGYSAWGAENVAKGQSSAEQVMDAWMDSPGHRANILNCDLRTIGVGESGHAWTQKFGYE